MTDPEHTHKMHWTNDRIARLGYLCGIGWDTEATAISIGTSPGNIRRQASLCGLSFRSRDALLIIEVPKQEHSFFSNAARKRNITRDELIAHMLNIIATDKNLLDNIMDDDLTTEDTP